ncbi:MAG: hypothetical protein AB8E87_07655 [Prochlorococcus sp.]
MIETNKIPAGLQRLREEYQSGKSRHWNIPDFGNDVLHYVAGYLYEKVNWSHIAFTARDIGRDFQHFIGYNYPWEKHHELIMLKLEDFGLIKPFGKDSLGEKQWRLATAKTGQLIDICGHFAGYLEVAETTTQVDDFRSYLINNESVIFSNSSK